MHPPIRPLGTYEHIVLEREPLIAVLPDSHGWRGGIAFR